MSDPILFVVDDDPATLASLTGALERRFGSDYRVLSDRSPVSALARLQEACDRGETIALLVADQWMPEMTGIDWLVQARELCPRAARCLVMSYGDATALPLVHRAMVLGLVETCLMQPWGSPDERLYPLVSEILGTWARMSRPHVEILPGVFAAGDVRDRSVKRVASAVGEGAIAIHSVHEYLGDA